MDRSWPATVVSSLLRRFHSSSHATWGEPWMPWMQGVCVNHCTTWPPRAYATSVESMRSWLSISSKWRLKFESSHLISTFKSCNKYPPRCVTLWCNDCKSYKKSPVQYNLTTRMKSYIDYFFRMTTRIKSCLTWKSLKNPDPHEQIATGSLFGYKSRQFSWSSTAGR